MKKIIPFLCLVSLFCGCTFGRIKPGHSYVRSADVSSEAVQPQDPKEPMTQNVMTQATEEKVIPAQSVVEMGAGTNAQRVTLSAPMPVKTTQVRNVETKVGAAQKNTAQEIAAKLASMRWIQWFGVIVALFGVASLAYPPLRLIVNSVTTSAWLIGAGAALIFLPVVIVGHEVLILCFAIGGAALWFFAHRHGGVSGELAALKNVWSEVAAKPSPGASAVSAASPSAAPVATPFKTS